MVEEYMGFEKYGFVKDNAQLFEQAETEKLKMQVQQDLQSQQEEPGMEEQVLNQEIQQVEGAQQGVPQELDPATQEPSDEELLPE